MLKLRKPQRSTSVAVFNSIFIGDNVLLTINQKIDRFIIEVKSDTINIPFSLVDNRYNLDFSDVIDNIKRQGKHKIYALINDKKVAISYHKGTTINKQKRYTPLLSSEVGYKSAFFYNDVGELRLAKFSSENWLAVEADDLSDIEILNVSFDKFVDEKYLHLKGELESLKNIKSLYLISNKEKIFLNFGIKSSSLIIDMSKLTNILEHGLDTIIYRLVSLSIIEGKEKIQSVYMSREKMNLLEQSEKKATNIFKGQLYIDRLVFFKITRMLNKDLEIQDKVQIKNNELYIPLHEPDLSKITQVMLRIQKNNKDLPIKFRVENGNLVIQESEFAPLKHGYIIELIVIDNEDSEYHLVDESQKKLANIYRHFVLDAHKNLKTYAYFSINGRLNFYQTFVPIEILKAENTLTINARLENEAIKFASDQRYEAIVKTSYKTFEPIAISEENGSSIIDLNQINIEKGKTYEILLKPEGNFDFSYVKSLKTLSNDSSLVSFNDTSLTFTSTFELKLSVIVTFYNTEKYLNKLFSSLYKQGLHISEFEVLAINDSSSDNSLKIAEKFAKKYSNFKIITHQINKGLGEARNTGIDAARGKYMAFVDGDDFIAEGAYKKMLKIIERTKSQVITGGVKRWRNNRPEISWMYRKIFIKNIKKTTLYNNPELVYDLSAWNKIYNRKWFVREGFRYPTMLYEDVPVTLPVFQKAQSIDIFAETIYYWFIRDQVGDKSITNKRTELSNFVDRMRAIRAGVSALSQNPLALGEYENKVLKLDIPIYLRHFREVDDVYLSVLTDEISWVLSNFSKEALSELSNREMARLKCVGSGDFEQLLTYYEEEELA